LLAFAADGVGLVEDGGDALLFGQGWEGDFDIPYLCWPCAN